VKKIKAKTALSNLNVVKCIVFNKMFNLKGNITLFNTLGPRMHQILHRTMGGGASMSVVIYFPAVL
jgi:hypothetical protein